MAVRIDDVRDLTAGLPRSYEVFVGRRIKFRVGRIVYLAFSRDETLMGFAFPKEEREAALETYPDKFLRPKPSDLRYQWLVVRLEAIDKDELRELVFDAWRMVVPKKLAALSDDKLRQLGAASRAGGVVATGAPIGAARVACGGQALKRHPRTLGQACVL
jgi:hypothetical protein